jgi:polyisoprenyl-phosphate glycosyltransferase
VAIDYQSSMTVVGTTGRCTGCAVLRPASFEVSVLIPVFNEALNLPELYRRLTSTLENEGIDYELLFVDDGSRDDSLALLRGLAAQDDRVRIIALARNFGHQMALTAGLNYALGRALIVMDADLQDPPEVLPQFIAKWREGYEVVYATRAKRKEHLLKRASYHAFYVVLRTVAGIDIPLDSGDFSLMDRSVVEIINSMPERTRFLRGLRSWVGFRQIGITYERDQRYAGYSKYSFAKLVRLALAGIIAFSDLPLRLASFIGFGAAIISILLGIYYLTQKVFWGLGPAGFPTLVVLILFLGGVQLITIGILGEYLGRALEESKQRPLFIVKDVVGYEK